MLHFSKEDSYLKLANGGSTVVYHLSRHFKVEGLSPGLLAPLALEAMAKSCRFFSAFYLRGLYYNLFTAVIVAILKESKSNICGARLGTYH